MDIVTDIVDFGTRRLKTIFSIEIGYDINCILQEGGITLNPLRVAIDYRFNTCDEFWTTQLHPINSSGVAFFGCRGREFRIILQADENDVSYFELDYIKVNGIVLGH